MLRVGLLARLSIAAMVLVGAGFEPTVVREKSWPQREPSPATPPAELMQAERMSARVLSSAVGTVSPGGTLVPGAVPVVVLTSWLARVKEAAREGTSAGEEPMAVADVMKGARAETAATVVSSLMLMKVAGVSEEQGPSAAMSAMLGFVVERPGLPPV